MPIYSIHRKKYLKYYNKKIEYFTFLFLIRTQIFKYSFMANSIFLI